ncbi:hypothetical protein OH76DRAFT_1488525 [Lentinus brumalis]|uniref:Uncharacterized protein n=1 Tax=Lentinus brumalis TaxID=2498619 RepID=A0A371CQT9_9APHY|nr:hypothetical protein OH76DRAFT_1488525 [Polyporus brumalis]
MHDRHTPPLERTVYHLPMALNESLTRTRGLEPEPAKTRNKQMVEDAKRNTVGPMPPVKFNASLKEWLDTVMDYCNPPTGLIQMRGEDPWTEIHLLDKFWADFLQTHTLEQVHEHPHVTDEYEDYAQSGRSASSEAISLGKRPSEEHGADYAHTTKKTRRAAAVSAPTRPLRRSDRIRGQQERLKLTRLTRSVARGPTKRGVSRRDTQAARRK